MKRPSITELQQMARDTFGRELSEAQAEAYRGRLVTMVRAATLLREWEGQLRDSEPAVVHRTAVLEEKKDGGD